MDRTDSALLITKPEAARRAGVGLRQIRTACERGEIPEFLIGGWPRVFWPDVIAWIESKRRGMPAARRNRRRI